MPSLQLNPANFSDWTGLHKLLVDAFAFMDDRINPPSSLKTFDADGLRKKAKAENLVVVHDGDELIGCAFLRVEPDKVYIGKVAVAAGYRGKGIGREIFEAAKAFTREQGKPVLELETRIELTENHQTFARLGFVKTAETAHAGFDLPTAITMQCKV